MIYTTDTYQIEIYEDRDFKKGSDENANQYNFAYLAKFEYGFPTPFGIKIFNGEKLIKSAIIGSDGGGSEIHENAFIPEDDRLVICCSETIFCLSIPDLNLLWRTDADLITCFGIYKYQDSYIIHGELEISRLDKDGKILWQQGGTDMFTSLDDKKNFTLTDRYISVTDSKNRKYKFDFNGTIIQ